MDWDVTFVPTMSWRTVFQPDRLRLAGGEVRQRAVGWFLPAPLHRHRWSKSTALMRGPLSLPALKDRASRGEMMTKSPFTLSRYFRRNYVDKDTKRLSATIFYRTDHATRNVYTKALNHPQRNRALLAEMVFTPFYLDIGDAYGYERDCVVFDWLADNTRDIWFASFTYIRDENEWDYFSRRRIVGFADGRDLETFQVYWELRDRSLFP